MKNLILVSLSVLSSLLCHPSVFARQSTKHPDMFNESENGTSGWPTAAKLKELCNSADSKKWRTVTIMRAGYSHANPNVFDFSNTETLLGISTVKVHLNEARGEELPCYQELITFSAEDIEKTPSGTIVRVKVTIDENSRVMAKDTDQKFTEMRDLFPTQYSTSEYYRNVLRHENSFIPRSLMALPSGSSMLKASLVVIQARNRNARVENTVWASSGSSAAETLYVLNENNGSNVFTESMLASMTRTRFNGGAKICPSISEDELFKAFRSGAGLQQIYEEFYDAQNPQSICSRSK